MCRFLSWVVVIATGTALPAEEFQPAADTPQIELEVRFASVPTSSWEKVGLKPTAIVPPQAEDSPASLDRAKIEPGQQAIQLVSAVDSIESRSPMNCQIMSPEQKRQLLQVAQGDRKSNLLPPPKVTVFSGQTAQVRSTTKRPFVVDAADGVDVKTFEDGMILVARADVCEDGSIDLALMWDAVQISEVRTSRVGEATVQVPETTSMKIQLASHLRSEETVAIWCNKSETTKETKGTTRKWFRTKGTGTTREPRQLALMVTPRVIEVEDVVEAESK